MTRPPLPPFTLESAVQKVRVAEDAWNSRDPVRVSEGYTVDSRWRNRSQFIEGRAAIQDFLTLKWRRELDYRLIKEIWSFRDNRIAVRFAYEWRDDSAHCVNGTPVSTISRSTLRSGSIIGPWADVRWIISRSATSASNAARYGMNSATPSFNIAE